MKPSPRSLPLVLVLVAAACGDKTSETPAEGPNSAKGASNAPGSGKGGVDSKAPEAAARTLPSVPPLTDASARGVLHAQLEQLGGDDLSRQTLLYLADLGDKDGADAARKMLESKDGKYDDKTAAAVAIEALLVYGEPGAGAKAVDLAKQFKDAEETPDEYLVHALGRVSAEPERASAVATLVKIAAAEGDEAAELGDVSTVATEALAKMAAPEAREAFAKIAADVKLGGQIRGAAVAGLLRLADPRGKSIGEKLVAESTVVAPEAGDAKQQPAKPEAEGDGPPLPEDVITGLGIEGAADAGQYIKKTLDLVLSEEGAAAMLEAPAAVSSLARIYAKGGGQEFAPWLRDLAKKDEFHEDDCALGLWALGDESAAPAVADQLRGAVAAWASPTNMDPAIEILDIAARRGTARSAAFRVIVDAAAQVNAAGTQRPGVDYNLRSLNVAAAHAFLKSGAK